MKVLWENIKTRLSRFIPTHINDPIGLVRRMLASKKRAAYSTLWLTGLGVVFSPVDWVLQFLESGTRTGEAQRSDGPHIFVCGPARSGTTLVYQVLADALPVAYLRNFTTLFPRAAILSSRLFTRGKSDSRPKSYESYYGKTAGLQSPCEANHLWNQWVESDESGFRTRMTLPGAEAMARFFRDFSSFSELPTLSKNNNANAFADVISCNLDNSYFICLKRDTCYQAQSLLQARLEINGDIKQSYGVTNVEFFRDDSDPVTQVIQQITYLDEIALAQQESVGADRFWIVSYESFCANPQELVNRVQKEILKHSEAEMVAASDLPKITNNNRVIDSLLFQRLKKSYNKNTYKRLQDQEMIYPIRGNKR